MHLFIFLGWTAPNPIPEVSPSCEAEDSNLSGEFAQRLEFNNSGPQHVPFDGIHTYCT